MRVGTLHIVWRKGGEWRDAPRSCGYSFFYAVLFLPCLYQLLNHFCQTYEDAGELSTTVWGPLGLPGETKSSMCIPTYRLTLSALQPTRRRFIRYSSPKSRPLNCFSGRPPIYSGSWLVQIHRNTFNAARLSGNSTRACLRSSYVNSASLSSLTTCWSYEPTNDFDFFFLFIFSGLDKNHSWFTTRSKANTRSRKPDIQRGSKIKRLDIYPFFYRPPLPPLLDNFVAKEGT